MVKNQYRLFSKCEVDEEQPHGYVPADIPPPMACSESMCIEEIMTMPMVKALYENPPKNGYINPADMIIPMAERFGRENIARGKVGGLIHTIYVKLVTDPPPANSLVRPDQDGDIVEDYLEIDEYGNAQIDWTNRGNFDEDDYGNVMLLLP